MIGSITDELAADILCDWALISASKAFYECRSVYTILLTTISTIMIESNNLFLGFYNKVLQCG